MYTILILSLIILIYFSVKYLKKRNQIPLRRLSKDVLIKIAKDFPVEKERFFIESELIKIINEPINVGEDQLARSIIFLSEKNITKFKQVIEFEDYRDVIAEAENKNGNLGHYFTIPFE